jgi:YaiO family outer membrane protein
MMKRLLCVLVFASTLFAQEDPVARARALANAGQRAEAIRLLEARLAERPDDLDARTLYGTVLSWSGDYGRAREELQRVLAADPNNADARAALTNVERWARDMPRGNEASVGVEYEELPVQDWVQIHAAARFGMFVVRAMHAERGELDDEQIEAEAYPRFGPRSYAFITGAVGFDRVLYPRWRAGAEYFHGFGDGFEASLGVRHLAFENDVDLWTASLGKYAGHWLFQGRTYYDDSDFAWQALARRYFGDEGSYLGLRAGTARDEFRSGLDLIALDEREVAGEALWVLQSRWVIAGRAGLVRRGGDDRARAALSLGMRW